MPTTQFFAVPARTARLLFLVGLLCVQPLSWGITPLGTIKVGHLPGPIAIDPSAHLGYVVNQGADTVSVFDTVTFKVKKTIGVGTNPVAIAADPSTGLVYVANLQSASISAIKGTGAPATWTVGGEPMAVVVDSVLGQLYVADQTTESYRCPECRDRECNCDHFHRNAADSDGAEHRDACVVCRMHGQHRVSGGD